MNDDIGVDRAYLARISAGFAAVSFAATLTNISLENRNLCTNFSLSALCVAIVVLSYMFIACENKNHFTDKFVNEDTFFTAMKFIAFVSGYLGLCLLIFDASVIAGGIFLGATAVIWIYEAISEYYGKREAN
jgi:uncharacterized membrane protein YidH (DUF202 family)